MFCFLFQPPRPKTKAELKMPPKDLTLSLPCPPRPYLPSLSQEESPFLPMSPSPSPPAVSPSQFSNMFELQNNVIYQALNTHTPATSNPATSPLRLRQTESNSSNLLIQEANKNPEQTSLLSPSTSLSDEGPSKRTSARKNKGGLYKERKEEGLIGSKRKMRQNRLVQVVLFD